VPRLAASARLVRELALGSGSRQVWPCSAGRQSSPSRPLEGSAARLRSRLVTRRSV